MLVLITYDVSTQDAAGSRRLRNVAKACEAHGQRVQNSVFECLLSEAQFRELQHRLEKTIDAENDSLRLNILHWSLSDETEDYEEYLQNDKNRFFEEEGNEPGSQLESNYSLMEQTDRYVTYITEGYVYAGGAHPRPWYSGTTFSKIDGSIVGYDMFADPEQLVEILKTHLQDQHLENYDLIEEMEETSPETNLILPVNEPWIETDSIVFCYQAFEIAPYAAGMPLCKISKTDLMPYLSEKGKSILF